MYQKEKTEREGFIQDVSKRKNRTSESEVRFRLKPSYTPSRQNPYLLTHAGFGTLAEQPPAGEKV